MTLRSPSVLTDPVGRYIAEAARTPLLNPADERLLARRVARRRTQFLRAACAIPALWPGAVHVVEDVIRGRRPAMKVFDIGGLSERDFHAHLDALPALIARLRNLPEPHSLERLPEGRSLMAALRLRSVVLHRLLRGVERRGLGCGDCAWRIRRAVHIHRGLVQSRNALASANLRLVVHVARQVARHPSQMAELIQEGNVGLLHATDKYDPREECRFHSYAYWWIKQSMTRAIAAKWKLIREPVHLAEASERIRRTMKRFRERAGRDPSPYELARILRIPRGQAQRVFRTAVRSTSLDQVTQDEAPLSEVLPARPTDAGVDRPYMRAGVGRVLETLLPREREVVEMRFGLRSDDAYTLADIAKIYNLSRERVRQIELRALEKLRHPSRARRLRAILDSLD